MSEPQHMGRMELIREVERLRDVKRRNWQPVEPREGMVTVYDSHGNYVGCMGEETWRRMLSPEVGETEAE